MDNGKKLLQADIVCPECLYFGQVQICENCVRYKDPQIQSHFMPPAKSADSPNQEKINKVDWQLPYCTLCYICHYDFRQVGRDPCKSCLHGSATYNKEFIIDLFVPKEPLGPDVDPDLYTGLDYSRFDCGIHVLEDADKWPDRYYRYLFEGNTEQYVVRPRKLSEPAFEEGLVNTAMPGRNAEILLQRKKEGKTYREIGEEFHLSASNIPQIIRKVERGLFHPRSRRYLWCCAVYGSDALSYLSPDHIKLRFLNDFSKETVIKLQEHEICTLNDLKDYAESYLREYVDLDKQEIEAVKKVITRFGLSLKDDVSSQRYFELERIYGIISKLNKRRKLLRDVRFPCFVELDYFNGCYLVEEGNRRKGILDTYERIDSSEDFFRWYIEDAVFILFEEMSEDKKKNRILNIAELKAKVRDFLNPYFLKTLPEYAPIIEQVMTSERTNILLCAKTLLRYSKNNTIQKRLKDIIGKQYTVKNRADYDETLYSALKHICEEWGSIPESTPPEDTPMEKILKELDYKTVDLLKHYGYSMRAK